MAHESISQFEHAALEADMDRLVTEIRGHRERPEMKGKGDKELIKEALRSFAVPHPQGGTHDDAQSSRESLLPQYAQHFPAETKLEVEYLLDLALHKGLMNAHAHAKKANPAVLDAFHDALAMQLHPELERRGAFQ